jgi:hypothetical protein
LTTGRIFDKSFQHMPWISRPYRPQSPHWISAVIAVASLGVGLLIGYTRWGATAAVVKLVEKELTETQTQIRTLEKRMTAIESILLGEAAGKSRDDEKPATVTKSEAEARRNGFTMKTGKQPWNSASRL